MIRVHFFHQYSETSPKLYRNSLTQQPWIELRGYKGALWSQIVEVGLVTVETISYICVIKHPRGKCDIIYIQKMCKYIFIVKQYYVVCVEQAPPVLPLVKLTDWPTVMLCICKVWQRLLQFVHFVIISHDVTTSLSMFSINEKKEERNNNNNCPVKVFSFCSLYTLYNNKYYYLYYVKYAFYSHFVIINITWSNNSTEMLSYS